MTTQRGGLPGHLFTLQIYHKGKKEKGKPTHHRVWRKEPEVGQMQVVGRSCAHGSRKLGHVGRATLSTSFLVNLPSGKIDQPPPPPHRLDNQANSDG